LEKYTDHNSAYCYNVNIKFELEENDNVERQKHSKCAISGPGQSNNAVCKLAFQAFVNNIDPEKAINDWLSDYYHLTSKTHSPEELINTFDNTFNKFRDKTYVPYKTASP